jgi:hypothetical protein
MRYNPLGCILTRSQLPSIDTTAPVMEVALVTAFAPAVFDFVVVCAARLAVMPRVARPTMMMGRVVMGSLLVAIVPTSAVFSTPDATHLLTGAASSSD